MKKLLPWLLALVLLLAGCAQPEKIAPAQAGDLLVHVIDVGQADCILIEAGDTFALIDGGNKADSDLVVSYLEQQGVRELAAVICTHPHEDHAGGLPGVLAVYPAKAVYAPSKTYSSQVYDDFLYYVDQQGLNVTIPSPGDTIPVGDALLTVLGPVKAYPETNDTSIVTRLTYGDTAFLFTGDMEQAAEGDLLDYWEGTALKCDVLKVGHHGSDTSTGYRLLHTLEPEYAVISVGAGNSYGHPHEQPLSRLAQAQTTVLRTDQLGHILAHSDGRQVTFTWENQKAVPENTLPPEGLTYIGNRNSQKLHTLDCPNLPAEGNRVCFDNLETALEQGYTPCGNCME